MYGTDLEETWNNQPLGQQRKTYINLLYLNDIAASIQWLTSLYLEKNNFCMKYLILIPPVLITHNSLE